MTIKDLYEELKYMMSQGYADYEVEIAKPDADGESFPLDEDWMSHEAGLFSPATVKFYGKEQ